MTSVWYLTHQISNRSDGENETWYPWYPGHWCSIKSVCDIFLISKVMSLSVFLYYGSPCPSRRKKYKGQKRQVIATLYHNSEFFLAISRWNLANLTLILAILNGHLPIRIFSPRIANLNLANLILFHSSFKWFFKWFLVIRFWTCSLTIASSYRTIWTEFLPITFLHLTMLTFFFPSQFRHPLDI